MSTQLKQNKTNAIAYYKMTYEEYPDKSIEFGKIVEHWDSMQQIPESSANGNTMY